MDYLLYGDTDWYREEAKKCGEKLYEKEQVETVKFISTSGGPSKRKRSPPFTNTMAGTYEETTSSTKKKITFNARMSVKAQEEWNKKIVIDNDESVPEKATPSLEQRVKMLEVNEESEIAYRDAIIERVRMLESKEYSHSVFDVMMRNMGSLEEEVRRMHLRVAALEATNEFLRQALRRDTMSLQKESNRDYLIPPGLYFQAWRDL